MAIETIPDRLFTALKRHDHPAMAACYAEAATFHDIAFDLRCKKHIHAMWHMICEGDIRATYEIVECNAQSARVNLVDDYTFRETGQPVHNRIQSRLSFENGLIVRHEDDCDPRQWAAMAFAGFPRIVKGFLAGRSYWLRHRTAHKLLRTFICVHPEYSDPTPL
jgi:ketosteroid isomerase-like protein